MSSPRIAFQERLLGRTVRYAAENIAGYAYLKDAADDVVTLDDLHQLPILSKERILENVTAFRNSRLATSLVQHSSGTSGSAIVLHRSAEEVDFNLQFFSEVNSLESNPSVPTCISLTAPNSHGASSPLPYPGPVFSMDPSDQTWLHESAEIISNPSRYTDEPSDSAILTGLEPHLRLLTLYLLDAGYDFKRSSVKQLNSTGDLVTDYRRRWYEGIWGAPLTDRYSMSEILAGANQCDECRAFHFDAHVAVEVVDPYTKKPVKEGIGILVFTTLYPFVQKQPLIRYWSGDVVEISGGCPADDFGFRYKGRLTHCLLDPESNPLKAFLFGSDVMEVLDPLPDIARSAPFGTVRGVADPTALGHPRCSINFEKQSEKVVIRLKAELRFSRHYFPDRTKDLVERIRRSLLERHPHLESAVAKGAASFWVEPVNLGETNPFRPASVRIDP